MLERHVAVVAEDLPDIYAYKTQSRADVSCKWLL
jgi:hypothetical protein